MIQKVERYIDSDGACFATEKEAKDSELLKRYEEMFIVIPQTHHLYSTYMGYEQVAKKALLKELISRGFRVVKENRSGD